MSGAVVVDANLTVLLVVGSADRRIISRHKRLQGYTSDDFELLGLLIAQFSDFVLLPHVLTEASNLARQIDRPAHRRVQAALRELIMTAVELPIPSALGALRSEFEGLGLTDAVLLHLSAMSIDGINPTLITVDSDLANGAHSLDYSVIDYRQECQAR